VVRGTDASHLLETGGRYNAMPAERVDFLDMIRIYVLVILEICEPF
jgi:hypothetical protein